MTSLATTIRIARGRNGLTQQELANATGLSVDAITKIENGQRNKPRTDTIVKLADALGIDPASLMDDAAPTVPAAQQNNDTSDSVRSNEPLTAPQNGVDSQPAGATAAASKP